MNDAETDTRFVYDRVAYPGFVIEYLAPNRLRANALLHGWRPPDPETASVLEIGCSEGRTLIALGAASKDARLVGFDLSSEAIDRGRALVAAAGLENVELHVGDALTYPRDGEKFDYITCHGVLSWVPGPVRAAAIELMGARLAPGGLGYFGYDCLPGAAPKAAIASFLRDWVKGISDPYEALKRAGQGIAMLNRNQRADSRLQVQLDLLIEDFPTLDAHHFFHDWLAEHYAPVDLQEFIALTHANNLRIAGGAGGYDILFDDLDDEARAAVDAIGDDSGRKLALLDVLYGGHVFHRDLMIRTDAPPERAPDGITELSFAFLGKRQEVEAGEGTAFRYSFGDSASVTTNTPSTVAVLDYLFRANTAEVGYGELLSRTGVPDGALRTILLTITGLGLVAANSTPQPFVLNPGERPRAGLLARMMLMSSDRAVNLRINDFEAPEPETRLMIALSDGTRTRREIAAAMSQILQEDIKVEVVVKGISHLAALRVFEA